MQAWQWFILVGSSPSVYDIIGQRDRTESLQISTLRGLFLLHLRLKYEILQYAINLFSTLHRCFGA